MNKQINKQNNIIIIYIIYIPNYMNVSEPGHAEAQLHLDQLL